MEFSEDNRSSLIQSRVFIASEKSELQIVDKSPIESTEKSKSPASVELYGLYDAVVSLEDINLPDCNNETVKGKSEDENDKDFKNHQSDSKLNKSSLVDPFYDVKDSYPSNTCNYCGRKFSQKNNMLGHVATVHEKKKPFHCEVCSSIFAEKRRLKEHITSVHENKPTYKCHYCDRYFSQKNNMRRHVATVHEKKKPFHCEICSSAFAEKRRLKEHITSVHENDRAYECKTCSSTFNQKDSLRRHAKGRAY